MNLNEYQEAALKTAIYPNDGKVTILRLPSVAKPEN